MKMCNMCGNKMNDTDTMCGVCGNVLNGGNQQPINNGMHYNHQNPAYSHPNNINMQQQYNNMNQSMETQQYQQPMMNQQYQQPMMNQQYQQPMMNQQYQQPVYYQNQNQNNTKTSDIVGSVIATIGLYYSLNIFLVLNQGLDKFMNKNLADPKYAEVKNSPGLMAFSITWVALFAGIISLIIGLKNKKINKNGLNKYNIFGGLVSLVFAVGAMIYIYNYLS